jgi:hypothetical protein
MNRLPDCTFVCALFAAATLTALLAGRGLTARAESPTAGQPRPVEQDMHEFMEYVFEPAYKRLKPALAAPPADNSGWKIIKADGLLLAEGGNLLLLRKPEDDKAAWDELSAAVRDAGSALYQAARAKDYPAARGHYEAMLKKCNACHDKFAAGEHQLAP